MPHDHCSPFVSLSLPAPYSSFLTYALSFLSTHRHIAACSLPILAYILTHVILTHVFAVRLRSLARFIERQEDEGAGRHQAKKKHYKHQPRREAGDEEHRRKGHDVGGMVNASGTNNTAIPVPVPRAHSRQAQADGGGGGGDSPIHGESLAAAAADSGAGGSSASPDTADAALKGRATRKGRRDADLKIAVSSDTDAALKIRSYRASESAREHAGDEEVARNTVEKSFAKRRRTARNMS